MKKITLKPDGWVQGLGYLKQLLADEQLMDAPGVRVQMVVMAPEEEIPAHFHRTSTEFYYVRHGQCRLVVGDEGIQLTQDDMLVIQPGDIHALYNNGTEPFHLLVFKTNAPVEDTYWPSSGAGEP